VRLSIYPPLSHKAFDEELDVLITVSDEGILETHFDDRLPRPDRHFLLGIAQSALFAIEEKDPETVAFVETEEICIEHNGQTKHLQLGIAIAKARSGRVLVLASTDRQNAKRLARKAVRQLTGTLRLDIP